jgi:serine/threonine-protein kinase RsbW
MTDEPQIKLEVVSNPLLNSGVRELVAAVAKRLGFSDESCGQIALAVDEALCNVERHGYAKATDRPIWVTLVAVGGLAESSAQPSPTRSLKIVIEDESTNVDLHKIKSRPLDEVRPGGLGVHIIRQVMDEVRYEHRQPSGLRLTLIKHRQPGAPARSARAKDDARE